MDSLGNYLDAVDQKQGFRQFCKVADIFLKAPDVTFPCERRKRELPRGSGGIPPHEIFKIEHSETLFPAFLETKKQFPRQGWSSLKLSLKSRIFNENGQLVGEGGGGNGNIKICCLSLRIYFLLNFKET